MLQKTFRFRLVILALLTLSAFVVIEVRLYHVQIRRHGDYLSAAQDQQNRTVVLKPRRGDILDRNGNTLATSYFSDTIVLDTRLLEQPPARLITALAEALRRSESRVRSYWDNPGYKYVYRKAPEEVSQAVQLLEANYPGLPENFIVYERESKRVYPNDSLASHVIGFTQPDNSGDNIGLAGIERQYDAELKGAYRRLTVPVYSWGKKLAPYEQEAVESTFGNTLVLTVDRQIQAITERELRRQVNRSGARGGTAIVMDVPTGEILALANCPDFNLNDFGRYARETPEMLRNRILTDPIEVGSVMKIITTAILLDNNLLSINEMVNGQGGSYRLHGRVIKDFHPIGAVPFTHAFAESSNIVMAMLSERIEPGIYYRGLTRFGLGIPSGVDLPGEGRGILRPVEQWTSQSRASLAFGYECALPPIQVISAVGAIGNHGWRLRPRLVREVRNPKGEVLRRFEPEPAERVTSAEVCKTVLDLMERVVLEGTGDKAVVPGYGVGGKTGTTVKQGRTESGRKLYYASFAGLVPIQKPRLAIYVVIDEPQAKYGGTVSAPVFAAIARDALHLLQVPPDDPEQLRLAQAGLRAADEPDTVTLAAALEPVASEKPLPSVPTLPGLTPGPLDPSIPRMPDLAGLTMDAAWEKLAKFTVQPKMRGSGVVVRQEPAAGAPVSLDASIVVVFAHPSEAVRTRNARSPAR